MNRNRILSLAIALSLVLTLGSAVASNAPTSQFGFRGWPYRQTTSCPSPSYDADACVPCEPQPTCAPTDAPTATPDPGVTDRPTEEPQQPATQAPTAEPTQQPTQAPTAEPAPTPTPKPEPTKTPEPTKPPVATVSARPTATPAGNGGDYTTSQAPAQEGIAFSLLNEDRAANGLPALTLDPALSALARLKSYDMNANHYFAHTSPTLGSAAEMLRANGYAFTSVGENIAHHATVEKAQAAFMSSSGHRANILGSQWKKVGIGVCYDSQGFVYVTQLFVR